MNDTGVAIKYGDVALGAKGNFVPSASESQFDTVSQLQLNNLNFPNYSNPCELYQTILDGSSTPIPNNVERLNLGFWSERSSESDGSFSYPISLELTATETYSSPGLTLTFDTYNGIYSNNFNIKWYRDETIISEKDFSADNAIYFCNNKVDFYNKVVITFYSINMPRNKLKLRSIDYGYGAVFYGDELRSTKLIQEINPISSEIIINTVDFTIDSKRNVEYSFQSRQPLSVYFNGKLKSTVFVKSARRKSKKMWQVQAEDYIGLLDGVDFEGGIFVNKEATQIIHDIFEKAKIPYWIDDVFAGFVVTGYIPYTTCRTALMQVAFAIQAVVDTSDSDVVNIYALDDTVKQTINRNRIMQGHSFDDEDLVTAVEVTAHSYSKIEDTIEAYRADESGVGENIMVIFSEPLHSLSVYSGEIIRSGSNYALLNAFDGCVLSGKKYEHTLQTKRINNKLVSTNDTEKILAIDGATLVSVNNLDMVLEKCYNWLVRSNSVNLSIVEGKHIRLGSPIKYGQKKYGEFKYAEYGEKITEYDQPVTVGDVITAETEYLGNVTGRIIRQSFNLSGGIIIKEAVLR